VRTLLCITAKFRSGTQIAIIGGVAPMTQTRKLHAYSLALTIYEVLAQLLPDERKVIATIARCDGIRPEQLTVQDVNCFSGGRATTANWRSVTRTSWTRSLCLNRHSGTD
jgi:hypothetical protein